MNDAHFVNNLTLASEVGVYAHIPRTSRLVIGIRPGTGDIVGPCQIARGLGITRTPQTFVEQIVHAAGQTDILRHIPGRAQANNAVRTNFFGFRSKPLDRKSDV